MSCPREPAPCEPFPEDASYLTVGGPPCETCGSYCCWRNYLAWEQKRNIGLNRHLYTNPEPDDSKSPAR